MIKKLFILSDMHEHITHEAWTQATEAFNKQRRDKESQLLSSFALSGLKSGELETVFDIVDGRIVSASVVKKARDA